MPTTKKKATAAKRDTRRDAKRAKPTNGDRKGGRFKGEMSGLDAAAKILAETGEAMSCGAITESVMKKGYWSPEGKTPHATLYSAILREIAKKGDEARFKKVERGKFGLSK